MAGKLCVIGDSITGGVVYKDDAGRYVKCKDSFVNLLANSLELDLHNHSRFYTFVDGEFTEFYPDGDTAELWMMATEEMHRAQGGQWKDFPWRRHEDEVRQ